jgi:hypothetical protein
MRGIDGSPIGLSPKEVSSLIGVRHETLQVWRAKGIGPTFYKIRNLIYYKPEDVTAWIEAQCVPNGGKTANSEN